MTSATFRVITRGLQPGYSAEMAADLMATLFKCSKEQIAPLLASKPVTVKKGMAFDAANKYAQALARCGCASTVEPDPAPVGAAGKTTSPGAQQLSTIVPVLRRVVAPGLDADPALVRSFAGDLEVVFLTEPNGVVMRQGMFRAAMLSEEKLYQMAVANLYKLLHPRLVFQQMAADAGPDGTPGARYFSYIETGDGLEASCLLLWPVWQALAEQVDGPLRIVVPSAGTCLFCGADDAVALAMMTDVAGETLDEAGADALSKLTWSVDAAGRVTVVPVPPATGSGIPAQLVAPSQHAAATSAALMTLSADRLRRIQSKMFDLARWATVDDRDSWMDAIGDTLARGASRAAVVVDAANAVVASYTDELDCVVLLQFDPAMGLVHGWQNGTRLLAATAYFARDQGMAPDLQPGPGDTGRWGNVWPLIADLLTDDHGVLAARKREIDAAEWERAWQLGRGLLTAGVIPRDGRPLGSRQPAPVAVAAEPGAAPAKKRRVGLAVAGAIGLACLWSAANLLRGL